MGGSFKNKVCQKNKNIDPKSILERILKSFYDPFEVFLGPGVVLDRLFLKSKFHAKKQSRGYTRVGLPELVFGVVGPLNYPKRGPQSPKATGPRAKAKSPKSKGTIERGTDHAHGLGSPVADIYISTYIRNMYIVYL